MAKGITSYFTVRGHNLCCTVGFWITELSAPGYLNVCVLTASSSIPDIYQDIKHILANHQQLVYFETMLIHALKGVKVHGRI